MIIRSRLSGVTLVELMIALALGLLLSAAAVMMFVSNKETSKLQENFARVQENGRFALGLLTKDIRSAGFEGCAGMSTRVIDIRDPAAVDTENEDFSNYIYGYEASGASKWFVGGVSGATEVTVGIGSVISTENPISGTDMLYLRYQSSCPPNSEVTKHNDTSATMSIDKNLKPVDCLKQCMDAIVTDCKDTGVFKIINANPANSLELVHNTGAAAACGGDGNFTKSFGRTFLGGEIIIPSQMIYFIKASSTGSGSPSLWRKDANSGTATAVAEELVEGIRNMQVVYLQEGAASFVAADAITDWSEVTAARVSLLVETVNDNVIPSPQTISFNGESIAIGDNRLRKVFTSTSVVRNKVR